MCQVLKPLLRVLFLCPWLWEVSRCTKVKFNNPENKKSNNPGNDAADLLSECTLFILPVFLTSARIFPSSFLLSTPSRFSTLPDSGTMFLSGMLSVGSSREMGLPPGAAPSRVSYIGGSQAGHGGGNSDIGLALENGKWASIWSVTILLRTHHKLGWKTWRSKSEVLFSDKNTHK